MERHPVLETLLQKVFPEATEAKAEGKCPFCGKKIDVENEFRDDKSEKEFILSGMCQSCQDDFFKEE